MISEIYLEQWRKNAPWQTLTMVEQDLIISRVLVDLYNQPKIKSSLAFRGGTALNKLFINPPMRYSEDVDLVQIASEPIGDTLDAIRNVLDLWLGEPKRKLTERSVKLFYRYAGISNVQIKLKIEINTTEHFHILPLQTIQYEVNSGWFGGTTNILTYHINELIASKLRALYQRRKGRDLFDLWYVVKQRLIDIEQVLLVFEQYSKQEQQQQITRAMFEQNLYLKRQNKDFVADISILLASKENWDFEEAIETVSDRIIAKMKGDPWQG
jgi:predicted nucleotidyltransferase component of viral defense system